MLLLALTCERVRNLDEHLVAMVTSGAVADALRIGQERLERAGAGADLQRLAATGQLLGRALLAACRAEDAEELFQRMPKIYESISRPTVRWLSSLDQAEMAMHLRRWGRAAEAWHLVADDDAAPASLRVEAMAGLGQALYMLGDHRHAADALREAHRLAVEAGEGGLSHVVEMLEVEMSARSRMDTRDGLHDYALNVLEPCTETAAADALCEALTARAAEFKDWPLVARPLEAMKVLLSNEIHSSIGRAQVAAHLKWLGEHSLGRMEATLRMDTVLALLARDDGSNAADTLGVLQHGDRQAHRERLALDVLYCNSRLLSIHGRHGEALRAYKKYAREAMYHAGLERAHMPRVRFLERMQMTEEGDAAMFRLPLRYRRAYRYIIEHIGESEMSIRHVAAHIDVTERALQMAFRKHLGMTPAELIRHRRMQGIRNDLREGNGAGNVLKTAERWGMSNRSTLAHGYRQMFSETPTGTLRG